MNTESNATPSVDAPAPGGRRRVLLIAIAVVVGVLVVGFGAYHLVVGRYYVATDDAYVAGDVVTVTPQVGGMVREILAEDTQVVKAGDVLLRLDATDQRVARARAQAELARAVRDVRGMYASTAALSAEAAAAHARVRTVESQALRAHADLERRAKVAPEGGISEEELKHATQQVEAIDLELVAARRQAEAADAQLAAGRAQSEGTTVTTHPRVATAAAAVREAVISEGRATLRAPIDGQIARRAVTLGTQVAPGTPVLSVVPLAGVWVDANFKEGELQDVRIGEPVTLTTDLYGSAVKFHGRVAGLAAGTGAAFALLPAQNATGNWIKVVQRVPVRIALEPKDLVDHPLRIGLSVAVEIDVHPAAGGAPVSSTVLGATPMTTPVYDDLEKVADERVAALIAAETVDAPPVGAHAHTRRRNRAH